MASANSALQTKRWRITASAVLAIVAFLAGLGWVGLWWQRERRTAAVEQLILDGRIDAAIQELERLRRTHPGDARLCFTLAVAHRRLGDFRRAEKLLDESLRLRWPAPDVKRQRVLMKAQLGDPRDAEGLLPVLLEQGADDDLAEQFYEALSEGYVRTYRLREAWKSLVFWSEWRPAAAKPRLLKAAIHERLDDLPGAVAEYRALLAAHPDHLDGRVRLAQTLLRMNEVEAALAEFQTLGPNAPDSPELWLCWGACLRRLGRSDEARVKFQQLEGRSLTAEQQSAVHAELGELELAQGDYPQAVARLEKAVERDPREPRLQFALARAYQLANQPERAEHHRQRHAELRRQSERLHEVTRRLIDDANNVELRLEAAMILRDQGFENDARGWLHSILQINPEHAGAREALAAAPPAKPR
jgi:tetratricopeptide (TPR) repeat protein